MLSIQEPILKQMQLEQVCYVQLPEKGKLMKLLGRQRFGLTNCTNCGDTIVRKQGIETKSLWLNRNDSVNVVSVYHLY